MSKVVIKQKHNKDEDEVRQIVEEVEQKLAADYDLKTRWNGDAVEFKRSGLTGELSMEPGCVVIKLKLGMIPAEWQSISQVSLLGEIILCHKKGYMLCT